MDTTRTTNGVGLRARIARGKDVWNDPEQMTAVAIQPEPRDERPAWERRRNIRRGDFRAVADLTPAPRR